MLQQLRRHEFVHVVSEDRRAGDPLAVNLAPAELRHRHVQFVLLYLLPILRSQDVTERMGVVVHDRFRVPGRSTREIDQHDVARVHRFGRIGSGALPGLGFVGDQRVESEPAIALPGHADAVLD